MSITKKNVLIVLSGPTAVGKTSFSIELAEKYYTNIISADSRQFFKELQIGTAVPSCEEQQKIKHHFVQNMSIKDYYNAYSFEKDTLNLLQELFKINNIQLMVGGSGMYIDAVCKGIDYMPDIDEELRASLIKKLEDEGLESLRADLKNLDPEFYNQADLNNKQRILRALEVCKQTGKPYSSFRKSKAKKRDFQIIKIALNMDREKLYERINLRVDLMIKEGLIDEAKSVKEFRGQYALKTVGYRELFSYFDGEYDLERAVELIKRNTRHYARRQISWINRDKEYKWFYPEDKNLIAEYINKKIQSSD